MSRSYKVKPTPKQAKALELIRDGVRPVEAMRRAGYSDETSHAPTDNLLSSAGAKTFMEQYRDAYIRVGITPTYMLEKTAEWLEAQKVHSSLTEPDRTVPDYQTQLKAAEMVRKDWGLGTQPIEDLDGVTMTFEFKLKDANRNT